MTDITNILGGTFRSPEERTAAPPETQLRDAMANAGIEPPEELIFDGKIHRFNSGGKKDKAAWYVIFGDNIPAGRFGDWRDGIEVTWCADVGRRLSPVEQMAHTKRMAEAKAAREAELKKSREVAADTVSSIWDQAGAAHADHPYLKRKGIEPHGARITGDGRLIVPLYDDNGELSSLQYIDGESNKRYHPGGATGGMFWSIGTPGDGPIYIAEGFATAATIHQATGQCCFVAYSASNLVPVTGFVRQKYDVVVIVADNDKSDVGKKYAEQAAAKHGARVVIPPEPGDANDYAAAGHDLASLLTPDRSDWLVQADEFCAQPAPISWLVKHWLQANALIMVHGPSGGGKTFAVLDMCLHMAAGSAEWMGHKTHPGSVVYLAGEGHHGLRGRVAAWKHHNKADRLDMWLSKAGCDLNTTDGYLQVVEAVDALPATPSLIVVDTLHRFLLGDENSAQDAKTMLDACGALMQKFGCSVLLVHHTGVSDEAQHRARGSSAWKGALDIEISVIPAKNDNPIQIVQRKSKDAEMADTVYVELESVAIPGWIDEDGEPVTSAVIVQGEAPPDQPRKESRLSRHMKLFERAWMHTGAEVRGGAPYVSTSGFVNFLIDQQGMKHSSAKKYAMASTQGKPICDLLLGEIIAIYEHGWVVEDAVFSSSMMIKK